jgi:peptide/nickel transport system substrate-binding protein
MRKIDMRSLIIGATALLLTGCGDGGDGPGSDAPAGDPVQGGTAVFGILTDFSGFNPVTNTSTTTFDVMKQMLYTPLIKYDADLNIQPYLAESWELTDNAVTFTLREDVMWHDGQPVTAEDVKFTFDLAKNPETASLLGSAYVNMVESATVLDPRTIRFDFVAPHAQALDGFWWSPLPSHLLGDVAAAELTQAPYNQSPVGSGPFRFVQWQRNQEMVMEANPDFPEALGGRPYLDRVVFRIIPEATAMVTGLMNGELDVIGYTLLPDQAVQVQNQQGIDVRSFPSREFTYIGWNNERPIFDNSATRQALAMSLNRPEIIEALLHGFGEPASGMIPPWSPMFNDIAPLDYDPAAAQQLLAQAGWADSNGDGILDRDGQPFQFTLLVNSANRTHQDIATVVQQQLREIGVQAEIRTAEFQTLLQQHKERDYDAVISNWTLDTFKVDPTPLFSCEQAEAELSANRAGFCDPAIDQLITSGVRTADGGEAQQIWGRFSEALQQQQPITFLYWTEDLAAIGPRLQNVEMDARSKLVNVAEWWIPADRQR